MPSSPNVIISPELKQRLVLSISQYQEILCLMQSVAESLKVSAGDLPKLVQQLREQQLAAKQHDAQLLELLRAGGADLAQHPLYGQRLELIDRVLQLNHLLLPNINGMMALISNELAELRHGRVTLTGYKQALARHGRIVKSSV